MKIREYKAGNFLLHKINPLIRFLIVSDMLIVGALGMFGPLYALFVEEFIPGADEFIIGLSISVYLVSRSILQIPLATIIDKIKGERDDFLFLIIFNMLAAVIHLAYLGISTIWQLLLIQFLLGMFTAVTYPSFMAIFTRHIDKHMEGTEWGVYYTFVDLSTAVLATLGGFLASELGFRALIISVSMLCVLGTLMLLPIKVFMKKGPIPFLNKL